MFTVVKPFQTATQRFAVGQVIDAAPDGPWLAAGFLLPVAVAATTKNPPRPRRRRG